MIALHQLPEDCLNAKEYMLEIERERLLLSF
jgi:hypothetical protein